jgi:glycosyltransferase involved in cell wall biosynthesis
VHFHSVQRLTGSVIDACIAAGIPYFVTLHDGWWLSDRQFFVDANGMFTESPGPAALSRRRDNLERLNKAQRVLAVSDWVAQAYAQAGVRNVETLSNGLPERAPVPRRLRSNGALRLGHLGGIARIKGYHLLEAVLKRGAFSGLEVTVVDHRRPDGYERHEIWGATPVRVIGALKPHRVQEFYADLDVLVAPSVAPETYGLAVREALVAGLWVIASDRGAAAQAVTPGENGFVIDVSEAAPLIRVLESLDSRPDGYRKPPTRRPEVQSSAVQARALHALYLKEIHAASNRARPGPAIQAPPPGD